MSDRGCELAMGDLGRDAGALRGPLDRVGPFVGVGGGGNDDGSAQSGNALQVGEPLVQQCPGEREGMGQRASQRGSAALGEQVGGVGAGPQRHGLGCEVVLGQEPVVPVRGYLSGEVGIGGYHGRASLMLADPCQLSGLFLGQ